MVTVLADSSLNAKDVIAPVGALCGAGIAAFVAWFNARQSATERLQALIAAYKDWPGDVVGHDHVAALIRGQVGEMWHRYPHLAATDASAPERANIESAARRHLRMDYGVYFASLLVLAVSIGLLWPLDVAEGTAGVSVIAGFAFVTGVSRGLRIIRHHL